MRNHVPCHHNHACSFSDGPDEMHRTRQRHCLRMVLQSLMRNANMPQRGVEQDGKPFAQFRIRRQCRASKTRAPGTGKTPS
ncbi:hypothetical protein CDD83_8997 [Cordyceps sp. RAO-2017]|nr:hypothetical protein CDD83_8997 [Cordyceps sp. RAO-2017]